MYFKFCSNKRFYSTSKEFYTIGRDFQISITHVIYVSKSYASDTNFGAIIRFLLSLFQFPAIIQLFRQFSTLRFYTQLLLYPYPNSGFIILVPSTGELWQKNVLIACQKYSIFRESDTNLTTACIIAQGIYIHCGDRKTPLTAMNYIHIAPSLTQGIVALLALIMVLLLLAFVLVGVVMAQMALTEQSLDGISIVSLVVFVMKVGVFTFGTKVMLYIRMGQQAKGGEDHHRKKGLKKNQQWIH